jgi:AcrR family transcriptional regulator
LHANLVTIEQNRIKLLFKAMVQKGKFFNMQQKHSEAKTVYEELYNLVAEAYTVDHPMVLNAASFLINTLIKTDEYETAERYARISYESLTRPIDPESLEVAEAAALLAYVSYELIRSTESGNGNIVEAEVLSRKAKRIMERIHGPNHYVDVNIKLNLSNILQLQGNHNDEVKHLLEQCLATNISRFGVNGRDTRVVNDRLHTFYYNIASELPPGNERNENFRIVDKYREKGYLITAEQIKERQGISCSV